MARRKLTPVEGENRWLGRMLAQRNDMLRRVGATNRRLLAEIARLRAELARVRKFSDEF